MLFGVLVFLFLREEGLSQWKAWSFFMVDVFSFATKSASSSWMTFSFTDLVCCLFSSRVLLGCYRNARKS